jgi:hypothetical protein
MAVGSACTPRSGASEPEATGQSQSAVTFGNGISLGNGTYYSNGLGFGNGQDLGNGILSTNGWTLGNGVDALNGINAANSIVLGNGMGFGNGLGFGNGWTVQNGTDSAGNLVTGPITGGFIAPAPGSDLAHWISVSEVNNLLIIKYLIQCALDPASVVTIQYQRLDGTIYREAVAGISNLGASWKAGLMVEQPDQEAVSACLLARVNAKGEHIVVDLTGPMTGLNTATSPELDTYARQEGIFAGNLFKPSHIAYMVMNNIPQNHVDPCSDRACREDPTTGICSCGIIHATRASSQSSVTFPNTWARNYTSSFVADVVYPGDTVGKAWNYPVTVYYRGHDLGESCNHYSQCRSGHCTLGVCTPGLFNEDFEERVNVGWFWPYCNAAWCLQETLPSGTFPHWGAAAISVGNYVYSNPGVTTLEQVTYVPQVGTTSLSAWVWNRVGRYGTRDYGEITVNCADAACGGNHDTVLKTIWHSSTSTSGWTQVGGGSAGDLTAFAGRRVLIRLSHYQYYSLSWTLFDDLSITNSGAGFPTCTPTTCAAAGVTCGEIPDGCGGGLMVDCGFCEFSDHFDSATIGPQWAFVGGSWSQSGGVLQQTQPQVQNGTKAMLINENYPTNLTITARVRIDAGTLRAGVGLYTDPSTGYGYNLVFEDGVPNSVKFLNDWKWWDTTSHTVYWRPGQWFWFKFRLSGGVFYGKVWADGTTEPSTWWTHPADTRTGGVPALVGGSQASFDDVTVTSP